MVCILWFIHNTIMSCHTLRFMSWVEVANACSVPLTVNFIALTHSANGTMLCLSTSVDSCVPVYESSSIISNHHHLYPHLSTYINKYHQFTSAINIYYHLSSINYHLSSSIIINHLSTTIYHYSSSSIII